MDILRYSSTDYLLEVSIRSVEQLGSGGAHTPLSPGHVRQRQAEKQSEFQEARATERKPVLKKQKGGCKGNSRWEPQGVMRLQDTSPHLQSSWLHLVGLSPGPHIYS